MNPGIAYQNRLIRENAKIRKELGSYRKKLNKAFMRLISKRGLKKKWIAEKVGISQTYFSSILNNKRVPKNYNQIASRILSVITNGKV